MWWNYSHFLIVTVKMVDELWNKFWRKWENNSGWKELKTKEYYYNLNTIMYSNLTYHAEPHIIYTQPPYRNNFLSQCLFPFSTTKDKSVEKFLTSNSLLHRSAKIWCSGWNAKLRSEIWLQYFLQGQVKVSCSHLETQCW